MVEAITADEAELTATERLRDEHLRATHLGHLGAMWTEVTREACERRYTADLAQQLTAEQYERYAAAEEAGPRGTFTRLLRSAELAGHDVVTLVEAAAVPAREIDEPRAAPPKTLAKVLHHRVKKILGTDEADASAPSRYTRPHARARRGGAGVRVTRRVGRGDGRPGRRDRRASRPRRPRVGHHSLGPVARRPDRSARVDRARRRGRGVPRAVRPPGRARRDRPHPDAPEARAGWHAAFAARSDGRRRRREIAGLSDGELWVERAAYARAAR